MVEDTSNGKVKRFCCFCSSTKTYLEKYVGKRGIKYYPRWHRYGKDWACESCKGKFLRNHDITKPVKRLYAQRKIIFRRKQLFLDNNPRTGVCSKCGKKKGEIFITTRGKESIVRTHIHHIQYHNDDVLKDTVELCMSCHAKESWRLGQCKKRVR